MTSRGQRGGGPIIATRWRRTGRAAIRWRVVYDLVRGHEEELLQTLLGYLKSRKAVRLPGLATAAACGPAGALAHARPGAGLAHDLARHGIMAGGADFYAVRAFRALGMDLAQGQLWLGIVPSTIRAEAGQLMTALDEAL